MTLNSTKKEQETNLTNDKSSHADSLRATVARSTESQAMAGGTSRQFPKIEQEIIVLVLSILLFLGFSLGLDGFFTSGNLMNLIRNVSVLGILGVGMAIVVIGKGIDLSMVSNMAISIAWATKLMGEGTPTLVALGYGLGFALFMSAVTGFLIAYVEVPALFATLSAGIFIYGFGHYVLIGSDLVSLPAGTEAIKFIGSGVFIGIPVIALFLICVSFLANLLLSKTKVGKFIYSIGDNYLTSRIIGIPARPIIVFQYIVAGAISFVAGLVNVGAVTSMDTRIATSTMIYDVILVAVLGGVSLSGGKGRILNVVIGTMLVGTLFNGLTIMNMPYTGQNIVKAAILLVAIVIDAVVNPRDEQTAKQGDI